MGRVSSNPINEKIGMVIPTIDQVNSEPVSVLLIGATSVGKSDFCITASIKLFEMAQEKCPDMIKGYTFFPAIMPAHTENKDSTIISTNNGNYTPLVLIDDDTGAVDDLTKDPERVLDRFHSDNPDTGGQTFHNMGLKRIMRKHRIRFETANRLGTKANFDANIEAISRRYSFIIIAGKGDNYVGDQVSMKLFRGKFSDLVKFAGLPADKFQEKLDFYTKDNKNSYDLISKEAFIKKIYGVMYQRYQYSILKYKRYLDSHTKMVNRINAQR